jgi:hypothetical protein
MHALQYCVACRHGRLTCCEGPPIGVMQMAQVEGKQEEELEVNTNEHDISMMMGVKVVVKGYEVVMNLAWLWNVPCYEFSENVLRLNYLGKFHKKFWNGLFLF